MLNCLYYAVRAGVIVSELLSQVKSRANIASNAILGCLMSKGIQKAYISSFSLLKKKKKKVERIRYKACKTDLQLILLFLPWNSNIPLRTNGLRLGTVISL